MFYEFVFRTTDRMDQHVRFRYTLANMTSHQDNGNLGCLYNPLSLGSYCLVFCLRPLRHKKILYCRPPLWLLALYVCLHIYFILIFWQNWKARASDTSEALCLIWECLHFVLILRPRDQRSFDMRVSDTLSSSLLPLSPTITC